MKASVGEEGGEAVEGCRVDLSPGQLEKQTTVPDSVKSVGEVEEDGDSAVSPLSGRDDVVYEAHDLMGGAVSLGKGHLVGRNKTRWEFFFQALQEEPFVHLTQGRQQVDGSVVGREGQVLLGFWEEDYF